MKQQPRVRVNPAVPVALDGGLDDGTHTSDHNEHDLESFILCRTRTRESVGEKAREASSLVSHVFQELLDDGSFSLL